MLRIVKTVWPAVALGWLLCGAAKGIAQSPTAASHWKRHTIDHSSRGADGVRLADVNSDGLLDVTTGWEEGGRISVYLNPGPRQVRQAWPSVSVGEVKSPEDAVFADLDQDGAVDVVSCCEGKTRSIFVHWAPDPERYLESALWKTDAITVARGTQAWMFALPMQLDGRDGPDLVAGSKNDAASISLLIAPADPRQVDQWRMQKLYGAGWIMSLVEYDVDGDGNPDVIASDRKGSQRGVLWLQNPGADAVFAQQPWPVHRIGGDRHEVMFLDLVRDPSELQLICSTRNSELLRFRPPSDPRAVWKLQVAANPYQIPWGKSVRVADMDGDGRLDVVHAVNTAGDRGGPAVCWIPNGWAMFDEPAAAPIDISGPEGLKFDLMQLVDLDQDGDLDVITCEERDNLGVIWYENPVR